jgi:hypothetical protein
MELLKDHEKLATSHKAAKYTFILTELDLALTFCEMALTADHKEKAERNTVNAQRAYDSATHFLEDANFSDAMTATLQQKIGRLRTMLRRLNGRRK